VIVDHTKISLVGVDKVLHISEHWNCYC